MYARIRHAGNFKNGHMKRQHGPDGFSSGGEKNVAHISLDAIYQS